MARLIPTLALVGVLPTAPIERRIIYSQRPDWRFREYTCLECNRDAPEADGERIGGVVGQAGNEAGPVQTGWNGRVPLFQC